MSFLGVELVGLTAENGRRLLLSLVYVAVVLGVSAGLKAIIGAVLSGTKHSSIQTRFWTRQGVSLLAAVLLVIGLVSIWFSDPARLATAFGLISAGLAFALQRVVTSIAGYFVILRGSTFTVGDRISMGGVRGDVLRLGFIQTTIMEMGQPAAVQGSAPSTWVNSRQFTGRIVTVTNSKIFDEPVFNYTREFPFIWDEMAIPITYASDRGRVEAVLLEAARLHAVNASAMADEAKQRLQQRFGVEPIDLEPRVFYRLTDNWLELSIRFILNSHRTRVAKDAMSRHIIAKLDEAGIGIASATSDIVRFPPIEVRLASRRT